MIQDPASMADHARLAAEHAAAEAARWAPLRAFLAAYPAIEQDLIGLRDAYGEDDAAGAFIRAMLVGIRGLASIVPPASVAS